MPVIDLPEFGVAHIQKDAAGIGLSGHDAAYLSRSGFFLDTCLRQLAIIAHKDNLQTQLDTHVEWLTDRAAYSFLLQTATGLNSAIPGETNILGQFKHGWSRWQATAGRESNPELKLLMGALFADSINIRQQHLNGIGGHSYGSLVRKLLQASGDARILLVGAGDLSQSIQPYLENFDLALWNRTRISPAGPLRIFPPTEITAAADWATHIVLTTPADPANDSFWQSHIHKRTKTMVHLGLRKANPGGWNALPAHICFYDLDDVFGLRASQSTIRSLKVGYARKACQLHAARVRFTSDASFETPFAQQA